VSRNNVPPSAASNLPSRARVAPVYAPGSAPNNSASTSSEGSAPQSSVTNGPLATAEFACTISAIRSLPAPLGPVISTGTSERATWQASATSRSVAGSATIIPRRS
jgi:hypothetical protein